MNPRTFGAVIVENQLQGALSVSASGQWHCGPVYRKAAYYLWPAFGAVVLLAQGQPPGPGAIVTDIPEFEVGRAAHAGRLDCALLRPGIILLPRGIQLQIGQVQTYEAALPDLAGRWRSEAAELARRIGWGEEAAILSHLGPLKGIFGARIKLLEQGMLELHKETLQHACRSLIGLGYGATPSGDDFLTGVLSVLASAGISQAFKLLANCLSELGMETSTTIPGRVQLKYVCQKRVSQPIKDAVLALHGMGRGKEAFEHLIRVGHTSGRDILAGMLSAGSILVTRGMDCAL